MFLSPNPMLPYYGDIQPKNYGSGCAGAAGNVAHLQDEGVEVEGVGEAAGEGVAMPDLRNLCMETTWEIVPEQCDHFIIKIERSLLRASRCQCIIP